LAYIAECYSELHPLMETMPVDNESLASCPPTGAPRSGPLKGPKWLEWGE
jgi:hypothetical protein